MSQKKIGAKIVIDGEQEFRSALLNSKNALKQFDSELKLVTAQFKNNEQSMEALRAKQAVYQKQQQELAKQSKLLVDQIQKANVEYKKAAEVQEQQAAKVKKLEKALEEAKKEYGDSADEVKDLERELSDANQEYDRQQRAIDQLSNKITKWNTDLNRTQTELIQTDDALKDTNVAIENYDDNLERADGETKKFGITMGSAAENTESLRISLGSLVSAQVVVDVLRNCARAITEVASAAVNVGMEFEASMSNVEALSGASGDALERLGNKAREMGAKTIYSASESADAFSYMALAGWDVEQMLQGIEPVLNLAAAANMDLAETSDIVTDYITAFGLKASDAAHFSDAMAKAMSTSNTTVELLGESYKNCAATCGSMGIAMEDVTAVLATMANAGVKGGEAGTALNAILTRLATNTSKCGDALEEYGIQVYDAEGNMNSISSILNGLAEVWDDMSQKEQAALAKTIAGVRQYSKFQTIMIGVSEAAKEGGQSFDDYAEALRNCDGAAEAMAKTMQDNLQGDITILKSALEGLGIATEGVFDDTFRDAVQGATNAVARLEREVSNGNLGVSLNRLGDSIGTLTRNLLDAGEKALPGFIDGLTWIIENLDSLDDAVMSIVASFAAYKVATFAATVATEGFTLALSVNPYGAIAVALTALTAAVVSYAKAISDTSNYVTEEGEETRKFTDDLSALNAKLQESSEARANEISQMESQATAAQKLVAELYNEETTQNRRAQIISELRSIYPQLNIEVDKQGKLIGSTRQELEKYIDASLRAAKVEAAKEHLTEIAKEQFEAEQKLVEVAKQREDAVLDLNKAQKESQNYNIQDRGWGSADFNMGLGLQTLIDQTKATATVGAAQEALDNLDGEIAELRGHSAELGEEYQKTLDYIGENEPIDNAAQSAQDLAEAEKEVYAVSEELEKEFNDLYESIEKSISSSLDLTNKWAQEWKTSTSDMTSNIQSQIEGIQNWEENFALLADNAQVNLDQRVLKYLADMGTEGAGLVQELVNTLEKSPDELQDFSDKMAEYLTLESTAAATITDSYESAVKEGTSRAKAAADKGLNEVTSVAEQRGQEFAETMARAGSNASSDFKSGLDNGTDDVQEAAQAMGETVSNTVNESMGREQGRNAGAEYDAGIAEAFEDGQAKRAAEENANGIYEAFAKKLTAEAGNSIGNAFMGSMVTIVQTKGSELISQANEIAAQIRAILDAAAAYTPAMPGAGGEGGNIPGHADGLSYVPYDNYLARLHQGERVLTKEENEEYTKATKENVGSVQNPKFASAESNIMKMYGQTYEAIDRLGQAIAQNSEGINPVSVNVELFGEARDIFKVVNDQNTQMINATGYHALA